MFEDIDAKEYQRIYDLALAVLYKKMPRQKHLDVHEIAHQAVENYCRKNIDDPFMWHCVVDAIRKQYGDNRSKSRQGILVSFDDKRELSCIDSGFEQINSKVSLDLLYQKKKNFLSPLEKIIYHALLEGKNLRELADELGYNKHYLSLKKSSLIRILREH